MEESGLEGIIVLDASGILIHAILRNNGKIVAPLLAALIGIATEMGLGSAIAMSFERCRVYLLSGIRNPELVVAVFSKKAAGIEDIILGLYFINKIDKAVNLMSGFITKDIYETIKEILSKYDDVKENSYDVLTNHMMKALEEFGFPLNVDQLNLFFRFNYNVFEELLLDPVKAIDDLKKVFGNFGVRQIMLKTFKEIEKSLKMKIPLNLIEKCINTYDKLECKGIMRDIIEFIIDKLMQMR